MLEQEQDRAFMRLALKEARKGLGRTSPNPCVGAVIVRGQKVVATGYHKKAGTPHAEVHALNKAGMMAQGATLYVTLEPCNHFGRTPPCSRAVADSGIRRVVVGMEDPNPLVQGGGIAFLRSQGIEVLTGVLEDECLQLNRPFIKYITKKLPWVIMKAGVSLDGRLSYQPRQAGRITGPDSLACLHRLRDRVDAILVGSETVTVDNPSLTTRLARGHGKDPVRIILDTHLSISLDAKVFHVYSNAPTWIFCADRVNAEKIIKFRQLKHVSVYVVKLGPDKRVDLSQVLHILAQEGITSLLVEGGGSVHGAFLRARLVDQVCLFIAPLFAGSCGTPLLDGVAFAGEKEAIRLRHVRYRRYGEDMLVEGDVEY